MAGAAMVVAAAAAPRPAVAIKSRLFMCPNPPWMVGCALPALFPLLNTFSSGRRPAAPPGNPGPPTYPISAAKTKPDTAAEHAAAPHLDQGRNRHGQGRAAGKSHLPRIRPWRRYLSCSTARDILAPRLAFRLGLLG